MTSGNSTQSWELPLSTNGHSKQLYWFIFNNKTLESAIFPSHTCPLANFNFKFNIRFLSRVHLCWRSDFVSAPLSSEFDPLLPANVNMSHSIYRLRKHDRFAGEFISQAKSQAYMVAVVLYSQIYFAHVLGHNVMKQ